MIKIKPPKYKFCPFCANELETFLEEGTKRKRCGVCNWKYYPHVAASSGAVVINDNKVLLVKRARDPFIDKWMFPAGFVNFGEHPAETAKREVYEETGLTVSDMKLIEVFQSEDDPRSPGHLIFFYMTRASGKIQNLDEDENRSVGWFDTKNPPEIGWKAHRQIIKNLQKGKY